MSYEAINQVTRGLRKLLKSQLTKVSTSAVVTLLPPGDSLPDGSGVNLYLYRVIENAQTRNISWPGDRVTPPSDQPALGLQLSYLLTPLGTKPAPDSDLGDDAHTMLGMAMLTLREHPILNDVHLPDFDADKVLPDFLLNSYEQIKMTLLPTSLEELSKIWATINQPYRLSVAYEVSMVQLTPPPPPKVDAGIVLSTGVEVITLDPPRLSEIIPSNGALARMVGTTLTPNQLRINGFGMSFPGQTPIVKVNGQLVSVSAAPAPTDTALTVTLPTDLDAGPLVDVSVTLNGRTSLPLVFNVQPWLTSLTPIRSALDPTRGPADLKLTLHGIGFTAAPAAVRFEGTGAPSSVTIFDAGGGDSQATVTIPPGLLNGVYKVRLVLNDADNSVTNLRTLEIIPRVDSPVGLAVINVGGKDVHRLTINGARLNGGDVRLLLDGGIFQLGSNANAAQLLVTLGRLLDAGTHRVAVNVDGQTSRTVTFEV